MKTTKTLALLAIAALSACATTSPNATRPPKYRPAPPLSQYGPWWIDTASCTIRANAADFAISTDGRPHNGVLTLKAFFAPPLVQPPVAEISELLAPVPVEGTRHGYTVILAYDANNAAHMLKDDTYLIMRYQPLTGAQMLESSFPTHGLMFALADLNQFCGK